MRAPWERRRAPVAEPMPPEGLGSWECELGMSRELRVGSGGVCFYLPMPPAMMARRDDSAILLSFWGRFGWFGPLSASSEVCSKKRFPRHQKLVSGCCQCS